MYKDFEDYLMEKFLLENPHILDDDSIDAFDDWLCDLSPDEWISYGNCYKNISKNN